MIMIEKYILDDFDLLKYEILLLKPMLKKAKKN